MKFIQSLKESLGIFYYGIVRNLVSSYVRRHLLPVIEVLEERVSGLYAHLESRGVPMPTDDNGNPLPKDTLHLLPTLRHLDTRRIEWSSGSTPIKDGLGAAALLCDSSNNVTELVDKTSGWTMDKALPYMPNLQHLELGCEVCNTTTAIPTTLREISFPNLISFRGDITVEQRPLFIYNNPNITELVFENLQVVNSGFSYDSANEGSFISTCSNLQRVYLPELLTTKNMKYGSLIHSCTSLKELIMPKWYGGGWRIVRNCPSLEKLVLGKITAGVPSLYISYAYPFDSCKKLLHLEIGEDTGISLQFVSWSPTLDSSNLSEFQSNFHEYIAKRLASFPEDGSHPTLTLSQTVRDAITMDSENLIVQTKHWSLAPARTQV